MFQRLSSENMAATSAKTVLFLKENHIDSKEVIRQQISLEEVLIRYQAEFGSETMFELALGKRLGSPTIRIAVEGPMLDPFIASGSHESVDDLMHKALLRMGQVPVWQYTQGRNVVQLTVSRKKTPEWVILATSIAVAVVCGILIRLTPDATRIMLQQTIIAPLLSTFLGFLNAIAGPMIFLSVVWGIYSIGDASTFTVLGKKVGKWFGIGLVAIVLLTALGSLPFFILNMGQAREGSSLSTLYQMILDIVPTNLFTPFSRGNTLQILMVAIVVGITMLNISDKTEQVAMLAEQLSYVVNSIMGFVGKLVPYFVFGSLFNIIAGSELQLLLGAAKLLFGMLVACLFILALHTIGATSVAHISPIELWRKSLSTFLIGLTTASSSAAFADNLKVCTEKHRISPELANFAVPFGQILYKPATALMYWFTAVCVAEQSGITVSVTWIVMVFVICIVLSVATPPVPGGTTASYSILFVQLGLPMDSLPIILTLNVILDFFRTAVNLFAGQCVLIGVSRKNGLVSK